MNSKLLSIIAVLIGILLPMKVSAQMGDYISAPEFTFEGDNIVMTCETPGASIYYVMAEYADDDEAYSLVDNLDISEANSMRTLYTAPFPVTKNVVIKAIAKMPQQQEESDVKTIIYSYTAWSELLEAIDYGSDVLARAQDNPNVSDDLKENLQWAIEDGEHFYYQERGMMPDSYEAVMIRQHILEIAHEIEEILGPAQTVPEPYAVLSQNNTVLTFYYDTNKADRNGMSVGPFTQTWDQYRQRFKINSGWDEMHENITSVVFDTSFANCTTLTSTANWFYELNNLTTITGISNLKTDNVTDMSSMFDGCFGLTNLDVSNFKTDNVTNMGLMFNGCSGLTSLDVSKFNTANVTNMRSMFFGCSGLTSLDVSKFNTANVTNMSDMFGGCSGLTSLNVSNFNTANVTAMYQMFYGCSGLTTLDASNFNTANVTDMSWMFRGCSGLTSLDVSNFNTANVKAMYDMFRNCSGLTTLDVSNFNTANVTSMSNMFYQCSNLTSLDVSGFNTDNVKDMYGMFGGCSGLTNLDVSKFNTTNVTNMSSMFFNCSGLTSLDVSKFNTANVKDMDNMFRACSNLTTIYAGNEWSTAVVTEGGNMFIGCTNLKGGAGTYYDANHTDYTYAHIDGGTANPGYFTAAGAEPWTEPNEPEPYAVLSQNNTVLTFYYDEKKAERNGMSVGPFTGSPSWYGQREGITSVVFDASFVNCTTITSTANWFNGFVNLTTISNIINLKTDHVTDMSSMFTNCSSLTSLDVSGFNTANVTNMSVMFSGCSSLTSLDLSNFNTDKVTYMDGMFSYCQGLTTLDLSNFKTENVTYMSQMFWGCSGLMFLDVTGFNTQNVKDMNRMFSDCQGLTSLDLSNFKTDNVKDMNEMFSNCSGLTSLNVTGFNTQNVPEMWKMFSDCSSLTTIYAGSLWSTAVVILGDGMFSGCTSLVGGAGTHYDANHTDYTYAHIDGGTANPGYFTASGAEPWKDIDNVVLTGKNANYWYDSTGTNPSGEEAIIFTIPEIPEEGMEWEFNILGTFIQNQLAFTTADGEVVDNIIGNILFETKGNMVAIQDGRMLIYESDNERGEIAMVDPYSGMIRIIGNEITLRLLNEPNSKFMALPLCVKADQNGKDVTVTNGSFTVLVQSPKQVQEPEPYAVLSQNNTVLTFYYDDQREQRNGLGTESNREWREYAEDITTVIFDPSFSSCRPTNTSFWFFGFTNLTSVVGIENLNTSDVSNMAQMFTSCSSLTNLDVSRFNTVNVTNMAAMFAECRNLTSLDVSGFNTAKVTDMGGMFQNCLSLTNLDLSHFDTHNVTDMVQMFFGCSALTTLDVSNFNTENVKAFFLMFAACRSLTSLDVSSFNTASATEIDRMFSQCTGLTTLDLHNFNTDNVTNMSDMFFECSNLKSINISNFITSKVANFNSMFSGCSNLASILAGSANIPAEEYARIGNPNLLVYVDEPSLAPQGVQNVVVNGIAREIILTNATEGNNNWHCPEPFRAEKITYTRNFRQQTEVGISRGWESIALPFTVQTITHETQGQIIPFGAQGSGKYFWLRGYSPEGLHRATVLEANTPYVISMPNNPTVYPAQYNLNGRVTFSAENTTVPATPEFEEMLITRGNITMAPIFVVVPQDEAVYAINVSQPLDRYAEGSVFTRELREVRPFEAATTHEPVNGARPKYIRIAAQPDDDITGIRTIELDETEGTWYSLDGRQMQGQPQRRGVYLQKGKKIVVK